MAISFPLASRYIQCSLVVPGGWYGFRESRDLVHVAVNSPLASRARMFERLKIHRSAQALTSTVSTMIHEHDVRAKIAAVLKRDISVEDLARWVMANSWNMHKDSAPEAVDLVSSIHLLLAERDDPHADPEFRRELQSLLNNIVVSIDSTIDQAPKPYVSSSSAPPLRQVALQLVV